LDRLIVIDDGSSDGTYEALVRLARKSGKIDLFRFERKEFRHAEMVNWAAFRAHLHGAKWIVNFDIDEFLWPPTALARLSRASDSILRVPVVNFIQSRFVRRDFPGSLFCVAHRVESDRQASHDAALRGTHCFLEVPFPSKVIAPVSPNLKFSWGNHSVIGAVRPETRIDDLELLHVPLRSLSALISRARMEPRQRAVRKRSQEGWQSAHFRKQVLQGNALPEWKKNSAVFGKLSLGGRRVRLVADNRVRRCVLRAYRYMAEQRLFQKRGSASAESLLKVGGLATMPSRTSSLERCIDSIAAQVDLLYVYLDKYSEVPPLLKKYDNIIPLLPAEVSELLGENKDWSVAGKFIGALLAGDCLYCGFDDDIIYPDGYARLLAESLAKFQYRALVGIHGSTFRAPYQSYTKHRRYVHFASPLERDQVVDEIGTGTVAFRTGMFTPRISNWTDLRLCDLMLAIDAHQIGLPRVVVSRRRAYLKAVAELQEDSLWAAQLRDDSLPSNLMQQNRQLWEQRIAFEAR
jgi:hypothetical protein